MKTSRDTLVIRVDAGQTAGLGHMTRCTALAQAWSARGGHVVFATAGAPDAVVGELELQGFVVDRLPDDPGSARFEERLTPFSGAWVVLDGYAFSADQTRLRQAGHPVLAIDDLAQLDRYDVDVILNQNVHAGDLQYPTAPETKVLLGTRYALLRREFIAHGPKATLRPGRARRILVTLGGSDRFNQTAKVLNGLSLLSEPFEATVVVGAANTHAKTLTEEAKRQGDRVRILKNPTNMPELMAWADIAVAAAGSTSWELAFMGLPTLAMTLSDNQRPVAVKLDAIGVSRSLGWRDDVTAATIAKAVNALLDDEAARHAMSSRGRELVDGRGADRVVDVMHSVRPPAQAQTTWTEQREAR